MRRRSRIAIAVASGLAAVGAAILAITGRRPAVKSTVMSNESHSSASPIPTGAPAPALLSLKAQIDAAYPMRNRASDGIMADARHIAEGKSDHIFGNAFDITTDSVNGPDNEALAVYLLSDPRTHYTIFDRQIRNVEIQNGAARAYTGTDPHTSHLHLSIYAARRDDASPWNLGAPVA